MTMIMGYLPRMKQLRLQGLDTWWYIIGVARVQMRLEVGKIFYFSSDTKPQVMAMDETGR